MKKHTTFKINGIPVAAVLLLSLSCMLKLGQSSTVGYLMGS